ncbi:YecA family protein [Lysobacter terrae]
MLGDVTTGNLAPTKKSDGTTPTERYLAKLGQRTFLSLWSYPNVYTPEGRKNGKGQGKELCDLLVVCGEDVLLFSDKDIHYPEGIDPVTAWKRWKKKAITKSIGQLHGAEKWIRERPGDVYLDAGCTVPFPLDLTAANLRIHLIAVTNNSIQSARKFFGQGSTGSFMLVPLLSEPEIADKPFHLNNPLPNKTFVHVLDQSSLDVVLKELDTIHDFVGYLRAKETAILSGLLACVSGEEDLLAYYIMEDGLDTHSIDFADPSLKANHSMIVPESMWPAYVNSGLRDAIHFENAESYFWDALIEHFSGHILDGTAISFAAPDVSTHERSVRFLAREGRFARRHLARMFLDKIRTVPHDRRSSRASPSPTYRDTIFLFVFYPRDADEDYESYREERIGIAHAYGLVAKLRYPQFSNFIIIATEPKDSQGRSEDCLSMEIDKLDDEMRATAIELQEVDKILSDVTDVRATGSRVRPIQFTRKKQGRNERCACGSGLKAKKCCQR